MQLRGITTMETATTDNYYYIYCQVVSARQLTHCWPFATIVAILPKFKKGIMDKNSMSLASMCQ